MSSCLISIQVRLWDIRGDQEICQYKPPTPNSSFTSVGVSLSGRLLLASSDDSSIHMWDVTGTHVGNLTGHENRSGYCHSLSSHCDHHYQDHTDCCGPGWLCYRLFLLGQHCAGVGTVTPPAVVQVQKTKLSRDDEEQTSVRGG